VSAAGGVLNRTTHSELRERTSLMWNVIEAFLPPLKGTDRPGTMVLGEVVNAISCSIAAGHIART
jgi:hypothetical protein